MRVDSQGSARIFCLWYDTLRLICSGAPPRQVKEHVVGPFQWIILVVWAISTVALIGFILMHSGKGTGVSDMIASSLYNASSATGIMEKNLDRVTIVAALVFAACVVLAMFFFPQGIVGI